LLCSRSKGAFVFGRRFIKLKRRPSLNFSAIRPYPLQLMLRIRRVVARIASDRKAPSRSPSPSSCDGRFDFFLRIIAPIFPDLIRSFEGGNFSRPRS